eukprot:358483-Chlamydomonas_euryale.AAC.3
MPTSWPATLRTHTLAGHTLKPQAGTFRWRGGGAPGDFPGGLETVSARGGGPGGVEVPWGGRVLETCRGFLEAWRSAAGVCGLETCRPGNGP